MILESLRFRSISLAFPREVAIDFTSLPAGLVALCGNNQAGKTHILELSAGATLFRQFAGYRKTPRFIDHVIPDVRDAFSELTFRLHDARYMVRVQADPQFGGGRGKTEAFVVRDGVPLAGPVLEEVDRTLAAILPSPDFFLASVYACQASVFTTKTGNGGFFALDKAARKDLVIAMLRLAYLQVMAERSRGRAQELLAEFGRVRVQIPALEARATRAAELEALLDEATERRVATACTLDGLRTRLGVEQQTLTAARDALATLQAEAARVDTERTRLTTERETAELRVDMLGADLARLTALLHDAEVIRAAAAALPHLDAALEDLGAWGDAFRAVLEPLTVRVAELGAERSQLLATAGRLREAEEAARAAQTRVTARQALETEAAVRRAAAAIAAEELRAADAVLPELEAAAEGERIQHDARHILEQRIGDLTPRRTLLDEIPGVPACAACPLTADARKAAETLATLTGELAALSTITGTLAADTLRAHRANRNALAARRDVADRWLTAHVDELMTLANDQLAGANAAEVEAELARTIEQGRTIRTALDAAAAAQRVMTAAIDAAKAETEALRVRRRECAQKASRAAEIAVAEAQRAETMEAASVARDALEAVTEALQALPVMDAGPAAAAVETATAIVAGAETEVATAETAHGEADREVARLEGERIGLGDPMAELATFRGRAIALETEVADWARLERDLGRDGVQALALDAAGPRVTALANELLAACFGGRFQVALETTVPKKSGPGHREVFDVRIVDAERPRDDAIEGCGGEMVVLEESIRLALALRNAEDSGCELRTLWRDESGAALSGENGVHYLAMLRKAMALGGYHQCFFITHNRDLWAQADACLFVGNGQVRRVDPEEATRLLTAEAA